MLSRMDISGTFSRAPNFLFFVAEIKRKKKMQGKKKGTYHVIIISLLYVMMSYVHFHFSFMSEVYLEREKK